MIVDLSDTIRDVQQKIGTSRYHTMI